MSKVNLHERYHFDEEIRRDEKPYVANYKCLNSTFNMSTVNGVCDVGCATGVLLKHIKLAYPKQNVCGIEYFSWQKEAADVSIKDSIILHDLRDPLEHVNQYDIVNCTEVGEHIDIEYYTVLMQNLSALCRQYLIMTWSASGGASDRGHDPHLQHLNPLSYDEYIYGVGLYGFFKNEALTKRFLEEAARQPDFQRWWFASLVVFERKEIS